MSFQNRHDPAVSRALVASLLMVLSLAACTDATDRGVALPRPEPDSRQNRSDRPAPSEFGPWEEAGSVEVGGHGLRVLRSEALSAPWQCFGVQAQEDGPWKPAGDPIITTRGQLLSEEDEERVASCVRAGIFESEGAWFFRTGDLIDSPSLFIGVAADPSVVVEGTAPVEVVAAAGVLRVVDTASAAGWVHCTRVDPSRATCRGGGT
jgi:hypothetical protein